MCEIKCINCWYMYIRICILCDGVTSVVCVIEMWDRSAGYRIWTNVGTCVLTSYHTCPLLSNS